VTPVEEEVEINIQTKMPHFLRCMFVLKTNRKENIFGAFHEPGMFLPIVMIGVPRYDSSSNLPNQLTVFLIVT
jgi:hypothetical protein